MKRNLRRAEEGRERRLGQPLGELAAPGASERLSRPPAGARSAGPVRVRRGFRWPKALRSGAGLLLLVLAGGARAFDPAAGTGGAVFMKLGAGSPRAQALGRAYVALAEGTDATVWNPAGVARADAREFTFSNLDWVQGYGGPYLAYVHPIGRTVVGFNAAYMTLDEFDVRDADGVPLDNSTVNVQNGFGTLTFARSFFLERVFLGVSAKGIHENNDGASRTNFAGDVGAIIRPGPKVSFGASLQNILNREDRVVQTRRLGAAFSPNAFLTFSVEASKDSDNDNRIGAGIEATLPQEVLQVGEFSFRAGYYTRDKTGQGDDNSLSRFGIDLTRASGISYGVGLYSSQFLGYGFGFDYAFVPLGALGGVNQFAFRMRF